MERSATNSTPATEAMKPSRRHWSYVAAAELAESLNRQFEPPSKDQSREQGQSEDSTDEWMEMRIVRIRGHYVRSETVGAS